jgi:hypothetical protein
MRLHTTLNRNNIFNITNSTFENKVLRLKKLLKNIDIDKLEITEKNIDSILNNANKVRSLITGKQKSKTNLVKIDKENITTEPKSLVTTNEDLQHRKLLDIRTRYEEEIRKHGEQTSIKEGFVYIIINPSYPEWIKAGMSIDYEKRLNVYNQYDPESKYSIISLRWTADRRRSDQNLLDLLAKISIDRKGEWFKIDKNVSINLFESLLD